MSELEIHEALRQIANVLKTVPVDPYTQHYYFDIYFLEAIQSKHRLLSLEEIDSVLTILAEF